MNRIIQKSLLAAFSFLGLSGHALAIQDTNANGMSDVWERKFNGGTLFSTSNPARAATADPDGDGWTNAQEAIAGTNPFSGASPGGWLQTNFVRHPDVDGIFMLSWPSLAGKVYTIKVSSDLTTWVDFGEAIPGTNGPIEIAFDSGYEDGSIPERLFIRIQIEDEDPDGDTLTSWEELALGYDPHNRDTDLDGIPDNLDPLPLSSATLANPDGLNTPASIGTNLRGFWDFESQQGTAFPPVFPDKSGNNRPATSSLFGPSLPGMPSKSAVIGGVGCFSVPLTVWPPAPYRDIWSISGWFRMGKNIISSDVVDGDGNGNYYAIYALYDVLPPSPQGAPIGKGNGLFVRRKAGFGEQWMIGGYQQTTYLNEPGKINGNPKTEFIGRDFILPAGSTDDGQWHHFAVTRSTLSFGQTVYIDGVQQLSAAPSEFPVSFTATTKLTFGRLYPAHYPSALSEANVDRVRIHGRALELGEVQDLYHQDIDGDQLWDITEVKTAVWRDANSNGVNDGNESQYVSSPFTWQSATNDTDGDEASDLEEQAAGTDIGRADTDGDLMPDGWELHHGLNPLSPLDGVGDPDHDGLNNLNEWVYNTDPHNPNSDGGDSSHPDTVNDGDEVAIGSNPNDPTDGGTAPPPEKKLTLNLGIGDQSGSESEDYVMNCYRIDKETGQETRVYTLRSGGFGQYKENPISNIFRKGETYTFQIQWQGSKLSIRPASPGVSAEGPDFDYTFKVEPRGDTHGAVLVDSWDPKTGTMDQTHPLLAVEASNVAVDPPEFQSKYTEKRVALIAPTLEWVANDGYDNVDPHADPWTGVQKGKRIFPDYKNPGANRILHAVKLVAKGGLPGVPVFVKSFDIDDSTKAGFDTDGGVRDASIDTNGDAGDDNLPDYLNTDKSGHFWTNNAWGSSQANMNFDSKGQATFTFRVGMQPGNNYRVVASPLTADGLGNVQVNTPGTTSYLGPEITQDGGKIASEPLTVWRRLWVENDSMRAIPVDADGSKNNDVASDLPNRTILDRFAGNDPGTTVFVVNEPFDTTTTYNLEFGRFFIQGGYYDVVKTVGGTGRLYVTVNGNLSNIPIGTPFKLYDDDEYGLNHASLPNTGIVTPIFKNLFAKAFILAVDAADYNPRKFVDFYRNHPVQGGIRGFPTPGIWQDARDLHDSNEMWVANLIAGYQGDITDDKDPGEENAMEGATRSTREYSIVYVETVRDNRESFIRNPKTDPVVANNELIENINYTAAHEIGHEPGSGTEAQHHDEGGLMTATGYEDGIIFEAKTVRRFSRDL